MQKTACQAQKCFYCAGMADLTFDRSFAGIPGKTEWLSPRLRRITAANPGPFTFTGTNTYIVGTGDVAVIDPGPDDEAHLHALRLALRGESVSHIFVTHTHKDHSPLAARLKEETGAKIYAEGVHRAVRAWEEEQTAPLEASNDLDFNPDYILGDGEIVSGSGFTIEAIATPGHTANHMVFVLNGDELFSGDHLMAWSTSIIAPPDGSMHAYMDSLRKIAAREWQTVWPGHGGPIRDAARVIKGTIAHREQREAQIVQALKEGPLSITALVEKIYTHLERPLHGAAALSVFAHLEDLCARGFVDAKPAVTLSAIYSANQRSFSF
jgi:glyoxylase-like metal-dependent hydrolase (beta-lactamase superfamily II)